jgi:hypothetical protein
MWMYPTVIAKASGGYSVTMTDFVYSEPLAYNIDKVSGFGSVPDGNRDYLGQFTLDVAETPEPSFLLPGGMLLVGLFTLRTLRRTRA